MEVTSCPRGYRHAAVRPAAAHRRTRGTGSSGRTKFRRHLVRRPRGERACAVGAGNYSPRHPLRGDGGLCACVQGPPSWLLWEPGAGPAA